MTPFQTQVTIGNGVDTPSGSPESSGWIVWKTWDLKWDIRDRFKYHLKDRRVDAQRDARYGIRVVARMLTGAVLAKGGSAVSPLDGWSPRSPS